MLSLGIGVQGSNKFDELVATGCKNFLVMNANGDDNYWIPRLKFLHQDDEIILRIWVQPFINRDPIQVAQEAASAWIQHGSNPNIIVQIGNEYSLWYEYSGHESDQQLFDDPLSGGEGYRRVNAWLVECFTEFKRLCPEAKLIWGTFSPGHNEDTTWVKLSNGDRVFHNWYGNDICREARSLCDIDAAHAYKNLDYWDSGFRFARPPKYDNPADPGGHYWQFPDKPFRITEFNAGNEWTNTDIQWLNTLFIGWKTFPRIETAYVFLGNYTDEQHRAFAISDNHPEIMQWFTDYIRNTVEEMSMPELTLTEKILIANNDTIHGDEIPYGDGVMRTGNLGYAVAFNVNGGWKGVYIKFDYPKVTTTPL